MCRAFESGKSCWKGDNCTYAHGHHEIVASSLCRFDSRCSRVIREDGKVLNIGTVICSAMHTGESDKDYKTRLDTPAKIAVIKRPPLPPSWVDRAREDPPPEKAVRRFWVSKEMAVKALEDAMEAGDTEIHISIIGKWGDEW